MIRALFSAASGMNAQQTNVENIANNIANANTAGFKARRAQFQDLLYQNLIQPGAAASQQTVIPTGLQLGLGTRAVSNEIIFSQGDFTQTDNPLDLVIQGNGFFQVSTAVRPTCLYTSRDFPLEQYRSNCGSQRQLTRSAHHDPAECPFDHDWRRRNGKLYAAGTADRTTSGSDPGCEFRQSFGPEQHGAKLVPGDAIFGFSRDRAAGRPGRPRHFAPRVHRAI